MRASDAQSGDILRGVEAMYLRDIELSAYEQYLLEAFGPNPPNRVLVCHRWMAWYTEGGFKPGGDDVIVYIGHRWIYNKQGKKVRRKIVREVLFRGRPCWVDPAAWRYLEPVPDSSK
jgi:hypothetical protein